MQQEKKEKVLRKDQTKSDKSLLKNYVQDKSYWEVMINGIVRPPRAKYTENQLGKNVFNYQGKIYEKKDYQIRHQEKKLELTIYNRNPLSKYVILYMHGNSSSRLEGIGLMRYLPDNIGLACFDFMGCGKNEEMETISLGFREACQAQAIVQFLKMQKNLNVILWGRSMGAATALLYGKADFIVADSSYKTFRSLCKQIAKQHSPVVVPNCMISCFFPCVFTKLKKDVDKRAKYDVEDLDVKEAVKRLDPNTVVVFLSGENDQLINPRNSKKLYDICPCTEKHIKIFDGDHNSKRPEHVMNEVMGIIQKFVIKRQYQAEKICENQIVLQINEGKQ